MIATRIFQATLFLYCVLTAGGSVATEIYKWVDAEGVTHYSGAPPEAAFAGLEVLHITPGPTVVPPALPAYQRALDLAERMESSRLLRERARREQQQPAEPDTAQQPAGDGSADHAHYYAPYYGYPRRPAYRHPIYGPFRERMPRTRGPQPPPDPAAPVYSRVEPGR